MILCDRSMFFPSCSMIVSMPFFWQCFTFDLAIFGLFFQFNYRVIYVYMFWLDSYFRCLTHVASSVQTRKTTHYTFPTPFVMTKVARFVSCKKKRTYATITHRIYTLTKKKSTNKGTQTNINYKKQNIYDCMYLFFFYPQGIGDWR